MMRSLGRNGLHAAAALGLLFSGGKLLGQAPEQHWQASQNYSPNNPPNYQPSTGSTNGAPAAGQYQNPQQAQQPVGPSQYPTIERRQPDAAPAYGPQQPTEGQVSYPQDSRGQAAQGQPIQGPPAQGAQIQGPPAPSAPPQAPFVLSPPEAAALDRLLTDWEKRNKEIHVMESKFYRWKYDAVFGAGKQPPPEEGELKFSAPDKGMMKIEAKDAAQSEQWLCNGKSVFQFNYMKKEVTEFVMPPEMQGKGIGDGPLPFVFGVEAQKLKQRYFMRIITPPNVQNEVWLEAYPRYQQQASEFSRVQVILQVSGNNNALLPYAIQLYSPNGKDHIVYQLQNPTINPPGGFLGNLWGDWTNFSLPFGWKKKTELPPPAVQAGLSPTMRVR